MFLQNTILGNDTILNLFHTENEGVLPSASTVKLFQQQLGAPHWSLVATYDVLVDGAIIAATTGLYGLSMATSGLSTGTYMIHWTWTSSVTTNTYDMTAQFNITADANAILQYINGVATKLNMLPFPDNERIGRIAKALGVFDNWNSHYFDTVNGNAKETKNMSSMVEQIHSETMGMSKRVKRFKEDTKESLKEYNNSVMIKNMENLSTKLEEVATAMTSVVTANVNATSETAQKDILKAFDIFAQMVALMFTKVDVVIENLKNIENNQVDFAQALPQMVVKEQQDMLGMAAQQMMMQGMQRQQMAQPPERTAALL